MPSKPDTAAAAGRQRDDLVTVVVAQQPFTYRRKRHEPGAVLTLPKADAERGVKAGALQPHAK